MIDIWNPKIQQLMLSGLLENARLAYELVDDKQSVYEWCVASSRILEACDLPEIPYIYGFVPTVRYIVVDLSKPPYLLKLKKEYDDRRKGLVQGVSQGIGEDESGTGADQAGVGEEKEG